MGGWCGCDCVHAPYMGVWVAADYFLFFLGVHPSLHLVGFVSNRLFVCWRVVGCLGQHCVLFVDHHLPRVNALIVCLWLWLVWCVRTV